MSRTGDRSSPFGVAPPKAGNASRFRLRLATMRRIGEIRRANFLERRSVVGRGFYQQESIILNAAPFLGCYPTTRPSLTCKKGGYKNQAHDIPMPL